jgi:hypothetical protein
VINSKAISIIRTLSKEEFKRLGKFLSSPFFITNKNLLKLYKVLREHYPQFDDEKFNKRSIYKSIYGTSDYHDEGLRKLFSELYKELNKYLVILNLEEDQVTYNKLLLRKLCIKKLDSLFIKNLSGANELIDKTDFHYINFLEKYLLQWEYVAFYLERGEQHKIPPNIIERANYLIFFFLSDLILTIKDVDGIRKKYGYDPDPNLPEAFLSNFDIENFFKYIDEHNFKNKEIIKLYYAAFLAFKHLDDERYYSNFRDLVFTNWKILSKQGRYTVICYLINYCSNKISSGKPGFEKKMYEVYRLFLRSRQYLLDDGSYIRIDIFLNITDNYSKMGRISEAKKFFEKNIIDFHPEQRKNILSYCNALLNFERKKYGDSLKNIAYIKTNIFLFRKRIRILLLKLYYEMDLYHDAKSTSGKYRNFLMKNKQVSQIEKDNGLKFLNIYNELLKIRFLNDEDNFSIERLANSLNKSVFDEILWIEEKIREYKTSDTRLL